MLNKLKNIVISLLKNPLTYVLIGILVLDIVSKWIIINNFTLIPGETFSADKFPLIPNFLYITRSHNTGSAWGLGSNSIGYRVFLIILRIALSIAIPIIYLYKGRGLKKRYKIALVLVYAGCVGNCIDITFYWKSNVGFDGVVDWIKFSFFNPTFNLADSYITIGVAMLIIVLIIDEIKEAREKRKTGIYDLPPEEYEAKMREENLKKNGYSNNDNKKSN